MLITFLLTLLAWIFFRANNVEHAINYILDLFSNFSSSLDLAVYLKYRTIFLFIAFFMAIEWLGREQQFAIAKFGFGWKKPLRWIFYLIFAITILLYSGKGEEFIYFQF
jgi:D-alanyl-lipoteichoic acid acyltransferase DltB (MBOAT superfamily)